jgi:hypothetical protein
MVFVVSNGSITRLKAGPSLRSPDDLLTDIFWTPGFLRFFKQNASAKDMRRHGDIERTRSGDMVPMIMGVNDGTHIGKTSCFEGLFQLISNRGTIASVDQNGFLFSDDDADGGLDTPRIWMMGPQEDVFGDVDQSLFHHVFHALAFRLDP